MVLPAQDFLLMPLWHMADNPDTELPLSEGRSCRKGFHRLRRLVTGSSFPGGKSSKTQENVR